MNARCRWLAPLLLVLTAATVQAGVRVTDSVSPEPVPALAHSHPELAFGPAYQYFRGVDAARLLWCGSATYEFASSPGFGWIVRGELDASATESREQLGMLEYVGGRPSGFVLHRDEVSFAGLAVGARSNFTRGAGVDYLEATLGFGRWRTEASSKGPNPASDRSESHQSTQGTVGFFSGHRQHVAGLPLAGLLEVGVCGRYGRDPGVAFPVRMGVALERSGRAAR